MTCRERGRPVHVTTETCVKQTLRGGEQALGRAPRQQPPLLDMGHVRGDTPSRRTQRGLQSRLYSLAQQQPQEQLRDWSGILFLFLLRIFFPTNSNGKSISAEDKNHRGRKLEPTFSGRAPLLKARRAAGGTGCQAVGTGTSLAVVTHREMGAIITASLLLGDGGACGEGVVKRNAHANAL